MKASLTLTFTVGMLLLSACSQKTGRQTDESAKSPTAVDTTNTATILEIDNKQFAALVGTPQPDGRHWNFSSGKPIVVDFYATWCSPCKKLSPNLARLAQEYKGKIDFYKMDVEKNRETASIFGFNSIPTLLFVNPQNGKLSIKSGYLEYETLKSIIKEALGI